MEWLYLTLCQLFHSTGSFMPNQPFFNAMTLLVESYHQ